jgi:hypothetical protein
METLVASEVRQVNTTWSPAVMLDGVAVSCAVGAGAAAGGGAVSACGMGFSFFLQPAAPIKATRSNTGTKKRKICFKIHLLLRLRQKPRFCVRCGAEWTSSWPERAWRGQGYYIWMRGHCCDTGSFFSE